MIAWLKANHEKVVQGHNGSGGALHLCGIELQRAAGATWPFVPYRGAALALQDMIGGRLDVMCPSPASSLAMVGGSLLRAYAVTRFTEDGHLYDIEASGEVAGNDVLCALEEEYGVLLRVLPGDRPAP
jgi:tripartite-type tricarboxylate transporter receptor subunit TctC